MRKLLLRGYTISRIGNLYDIAYGATVKMLLSFGVTPLEINLRKYRERKSLSQAQLGKLAKVRQATISSLETGKGRRVDLDVLDRIAKVLGVKATALLSEDRPKK